MQKTTLWLVAGLAIGCTNGSSTSEDPAASGPGLSGDDGEGTEAGDDPDAGGVTSGDDPGGDDSGIPDDADDPDDSGGAVFDLGNGDPVDPPCESEGPIPPPLGEMGTLAAPFASMYTAHDLGPIAGIPDPLGGTVLSLADDDVLIVVGASESIDAALFEVPITRDNCGHILSLGAATHRIDVPYADANLLHAPGGLLMSQFPVAGLAQERATGVVTTDLAPLGIAGPLVTSTPGTESPGGLGVVPPWLAAAGQYRTVAYPTGQWYRLEHELVAGAVELTAAQPTLVLDHGPGAFAYVPPESPGFETPSMIVAEWYFGAYAPNPGSAVPSNALDPQRVGVYEVTEDGDPIVETRRDFFETIVRPWGAYFDPVSGDFVFLSWNQMPDRVTVVRGFSPPPAG